jgi:hypothetical protein
MNLRSLDKFGESSPNATMIRLLILAGFNNDLSVANKLWRRTVARCLWTREIWGDRDKAELAAAGLILRAIYTEQQLKEAGINLSE